MHDYGPAGKELFTGELQDNSRVATSHKEIQALLLLGGQKPRDYQKHGVEGERTEAKTTGTACQKHRRGLVLLVHEPHGASAAISPDNPMPLKKDQT